MKEPFPSRGGRGTEGLAGGGLGESPPDGGKRGAAGGPLPGRATGDDDRGEPLSSVARRRDIPKR